MQECPVCGNNTASIEPEQHTLLQRVSCDTCGCYRWGMLTSFQMDSIPRYLLSAVIREASEHATRLDISSETVAAHVESASIPDGPLDQMDRIMMYVSRKADSVESQEVV